MNKHTSQTLRIWMAVVLAVCASVSLRAQSGVEYFFDSDPGLGKATRISVTPGVDEAFSLSTDGLTSGYHQLGLRAFYVDANQVTRYAPTIIEQIFVSVNSEGIAKVNYVEYFWDTDPGLGNGLPLTISVGQEVNLQDADIPTTGLAQGTHLLGIRAFGERGWGPTLLQEVYVPAMTEHGSDITYVEYFWDTDPGFGNGMPLSITPGQEVNIENAEVSVDGLASGEHRLFIRAHGNAGWTPTVSKAVFVEPDVTNYKVSYTEYFWNVDPGYGKGTPIQLTPGETVSVENLVVPTDQVHGDAILFVRYYGELGWSPTVAYTMLVDAAGNYTLNANEVTSADTKNYQTLGEAFDDFADRGISDNVTLTVKTTSNTTYELDATDEERIAQIGQLAANLESISENSSHKTIAFTASNDKNTVAVTTTSEALPTVVSLFAQTSWSRVALTINEVAYNFTPASLRHEIGCGTTTGVALSSISEAVKVSWSAQPHEGTTLSGFETEGEGDLPVMTIVNSGPRTDSLAYQVTLSTVEGTPLYSYTYYIYVRARMQNQSFASLQPATDSSVDPGTVTLQWNAFNDATGYRVVVSEAAEGGNPSQILNKVTDQTQYDITVKTGYTYTWTVTAIGPCDELTSEEQTLKGRLLPDFIVESITLPEAAPAGTELTVTAVIKNQGAGASTEGVWTDRLYYTVNSTSFNNAVQAADVQHEGNVGIGDGYEVTFTMQVPYVESGTLRVFVEANADQAAMETNATANNNRLMCSSTATMSPFYMKESDLAVLRQLYEDFGGSEWTGSKWNTSSTLVASGNWSGVTFDSEGYVKAINLQGRGLTGSLSTATPLALSNLTSLNLSRNALTGDPAKFINRGATPLLTSVNMGYNQIDELSEAVTTAVTTLTLESQHRQYGSNATMPGLESLTSQTINAGKSITLDMPAIVGYNHSAQAFGSHIAIQVWKADMKTHYGTLNWSNTNECYVYSSNVWNQTQEQDEAVILLPAEGAARNSAYPGTIHMVKGDVNLTGWVDVNDVQRTLNYIINTNNGTTFSLWAANTWEDDLINIQDIVCTVNIVLDNQGESVAGARQRTPQAAAPNRFFASGRSVCLEAQDEIAAFDLTLEGVTSSQVRLLLNSTDWQMQMRETDNGLRLVVFSPTGQTLPTGRTQLLRLSADGRPVAVQATSRLAEEVPASASSETTGMDGSLMDAEADSPAYDLQGRRVNENVVSKSTKVYIKNGKKLMKSWK